MQDPAWSDVFAHLMDRVGAMNMPMIWSVLVLPVSLGLRAIAGALWQRHSRHQQVAIVAAFFERWTRQLDKPLHEMSAVEQVTAIDRLGKDLIGHPAAVLPFLLALRVVMEYWPVQDDVLATLDQLTQTWHDKLPSDRKRRERRAQVLARRDVDRLLSRIARDGVRQAPPP